MWLFPFCRISDCPFCSGGCFDCKPPHAWRVTMSPAGSTATTIGWRAKGFDTATGRAAPWLLKGEAILNWSLVSFWFMFFYWWIFSVGVQDGTGPLLRQHRLMELRDESRALNLAPCCDRKISWERNWMPQYEWFDNIMNHHESSSIYRWFSH